MRKQQIKTKMKNAGELLAILVAMQVRRYIAGCIPR
jgi:hypothetical protein